MWRRRQQEFQRIGCGKHLKWWDFVAKRGQQPYANSAHAKRKGSLRNTFCAQQTLNNFSGRVPFNWLWEKSRKDTRSSCSIVLGSCPESLFLLTSKLQELRMIKVPLKGLKDNYLSLSFSLCISVRMWVCGCKHQARERACVCKRYVFECTQTSLNWTVPKCKQWLAVLQQRHMITSKRLCVVLYKVNVKGSSGTGPQNLLWLILKICSRGKYFESLGGSWSSKEFQPKSSILLLKWAIQLRTKRAVLHLGHVNKSGKHPAIECIMWKMQVCKGISDVVSNTHRQP